MITKFLIQVKVRITRAIFTPNITIKRYCDNSRQQFSLFNPCSTQKIKEAGIKALHSELLTELSSRFSSRFSSRNEFFSIFEFRDE